jgi:hypothetical protein
MDPADWFESCIDQARRILGGLDLTGLPSVPMDDPDFGEALPRVTAVYFIMGRARKRPLYIGRASNLQFRRATPRLFLDHTQIDWHRCHHRLEDAPALKCATLRWLEVPRRYLGISEILLIQHYKPKWNVARD